MQTTLFFSSPSPQSISISSSLNRNHSKTPKPNHHQQHKTKTPDHSLSTTDPNVALAPIKMPTAPWMMGPLLLQSHQVLDLSKPIPRKNSRDAKAEQKSNKALFGKESGVRGKKAMKKIIQNIGRLNQSDYFADTQMEKGEEFEVLEKIGGGGDDDDVEVGFGGKNMPWTREEKVVIGRVRKEKVVTAAEMSLDKALLERLRDVAKTMRKWVKVKKAGVTQGVVDEIRSIWRRNELAMVKFDVPLCKNMDRAREIVELKTGGLVVWSTKDTLVIYRGCNYKLTVKTIPQRQTWSAGGQEIHIAKFSHLTSEKTINISQLESKTSPVDEKMCLKDGEELSIPAGSFMRELSDGEPINGSLFERETDRLLDGLGPRFIDWWMRKPLPIDADLLPEMVPGFRLTFRLCPSNARSKLKDGELMYLRKLAHALPTHFVLGRNRRLQGLAAAILKLWEKCLIVKIAVKWGVPNTNNELMANELKFLTGGVLLLRNKFYIILFRGKDFVPCQLVESIAEREMELKMCQLNEEGARLRAIEIFHMADEPLANTSIIGTLSEFQDIQTKFGDLEKGDREFELQIEAEKEKVERELKMQEHKLSILNSKIDKSAKELSKLNSKWTPSEHDADQEMMTEEERECFRKMGLKMVGSLMLGRRGVFGGVLEGLHQHWKHREVVKVITMQREFGRVIYTAKLLEAESGGVLVSVEKLKEGHAIIIYRGKNYKRPLKLATHNLLTKRDALRRSLEMQRLGSLKFFAYQRQRAITELKLKLAELEDFKEENLKSPQTIF
ncbi:CRS1_YhbY domain-containing protein [Cephalotus follicularis]|uniref:CRS1_YhbY domain-containing protein n=1 Tax=Cephalotus follicularis TaxID=3775 RepID=A0A1Q3CZD3_CEPFO|nr:CRS1_YhbY domain-containing protein [Cephalotus follicularis]